MLTAPFLPKPEELWLVFGASGAQVTNKSHCGGAGRAEPCLASASGWLGHLFLDLTLMTKNCLLLDKVVRKEY